MWKISGFLSVLVMGLVSMAFAQVNIDVPFKEWGVQFWETVIPVSIAIISALGMWVAIRGGHIGIFMAIVGVLMLIFFTGAIPELVQAANLNWPF